MCETIRAIERHPASQRKCLEIRLELARAITTLRRILAAKEEADAVVRGNA